jgi:hypothetical protein
MLPYDLMDQTIANELEIPVDEFIRKIESVSYWKAEVMILAVLSEEQQKINKVKKILNTIV